MFVILIRIKNLKIIAFSDENSKITRFSSKNGALTVRDIKFPFKNFCDKNNNSNNYKGKSIEGVEYLCTNESKILNCVIQNALSDERLLMIILYHSFGGLSEHFRE